MYTSLEHYIDGSWVKPTGSKKQDVINPANSKPIGELGHVSKGDLDKALAAADKGFKTWRRVSAFERGKILRKAGELMRARADEIAKVLTQEQGKMLAEVQDGGAEPAPTSSTGTPARASAPTAASSRPAPTACATW